MVLFRCFFLRPHAWLPPQSQTWLICWQMTLVNYIGDALCTLCWWFVRVWHWWWLVYFWYWFVHGQFWCRLYCDRTNQLLVMPESKGDATTRNWTVSFARLIVHVISEWFCRVWITFYLEFFNVFVECHSDESNTNLTVDCWCFVLSQNWVS